jgi:uncharacterized protein YjiS (DUF1127 family)
MKNKIMIDKLLCGQQAAQDTTQSLDAKILLMLNQVCLFRHRAKTRKVLANLSLERLEDIGLSTSQVEAEVSKPFWK